MISFLELKMFLIQHWFAARLDAFACHGAGGFWPVVLTFCSVVTVVEPPGVEMVVSFFAVVVSEQPTNDAEIKLVISNAAVIRFMQ